MPELSRRLFLFGSAAAVAAASIPFAVKEAIHVPFVTQVAAQQKFKNRHVLELLAGFDSSNEDGIASVDLIANERTLLHYAMNQRGSSFRWVAALGHSIKIAGNETFLLNVRSEGGIGSLSMVCHDWIDDSEYPIEVYERHFFPSQGPAKVLMLYPDNSLQARRQRAEDRVRSSG